MIINKAGNGNTEEPKERKRRNKGHNLPKVFNIIFTTRKREKRGDVALRINSRKEPV